MKEAGSFTNLECKGCVCSKCEEQCSTASGHLTLYLHPLKNDYFGGSKPVEEVGLSVSIAHSSCQDSAMD